MSETTESGSPLRVLTLAPFFPSEQNEVSGCFIAEPIPELAQFGLNSSVIAVSPLYHARTHASRLAVADWVSYPQIPGTLGLSSAGKFLYARVLRAHSESPQA